MSKFNNKGIAQRKAAEFSVHEIYANAESRDYFLVEGEKERGKLLHFKEKVKSFKFNFKAGNARLVLPILQEAIEGRELAIIMSANEMIDD